MSAGEVAAFRLNPNIDAIVQVRIWDEGAKVPGKPTPDFAHYVPLLQRVVDAHASDREA
jgi:predicted HD phosphohydrolase